MTLRASIFVNKNKMILAYRALNFYLCNAKQENNLTLPNTPKGHPPPARFRREV